MLSEEMLYLHISAQTYVQGLNEEQMNHNYKNCSDLERAQIHGEHRSAQICIISIEL